MAFLMHACLKVAYLQLEAKQGCQLVARCLGRHPRGSLSVAATDGTLTLLAASPHAAHSELPSAPFEEAAAAAPVPCGWAGAGSSRLSRSKSSWEGAGLVGLRGAGEVTRAGRLLELVERTGPLSSCGPVVGGEATLSGTAGSAGQGRGQIQRHEAIG